MIDLLRWSSAHNFVSNCRLVQCLIYSFDGVGRFYFANVHAFILISSLWTHILNTGLVTYFFRCYKHVFFLQKCYIICRICEPHWELLASDLIVRAPYWAPDEENRCRHISSQQLWGQLAQEWLPVYLFNLPQILTPPHPQFAGLLHFYLSHFISAH